jgi:hypothetical protein
MTSKKTLSKIRGWFPKEPILSTHTTPSQTKPNQIKIVIQNLVLGFLILAGLFCSFLILNNSWIKFAFIGLILVGGLVWRYSHGNVRKAFKFFVVVVLIFSISFTAVEFDLFWNAGYPPTFATAQPGIALSNTTILNASLSQIVQDIERTPTYDLLKVQYGVTAAETIKLDASFPGGLVQVDFTD